MYSISKHDLLHIADHLQFAFPLLRGRSLFITGATGFFGKWILESLVFLNDHHDLKITIHALSRDPKSFLNKMPHLEREDIHFLQGDICDLSSFKDFSPSVDYIIHAATEASDDLNRHHPDLMLQTILKGMENLLYLRRVSQAKKLLFTSSGAVYGATTKDQGPTSEDYLGAPSSMNSLSAYGEGKRVSELMGVITSKKEGFDFVSARCFAFVGPHLPLTTHFAIGNFMSNLLKSEKIVIQGDGTPIRSYLYSADLIIGLFKILFKGMSGEAYNLGSDQALSISELAQKVAQSRGPHLAPEIEIKGRVDPYKKVPSYLPSIEKAKRDLGFEITVPLEEAIRKTLDWYQL